MSEQAYNPISDPKHYHRDGIDFECVELSTAYPHPIASAVEYVFRHKAKNGVEDLRKAQWWIQYAQNHPTSTMLMPIPNNQHFTRLLQLRALTQGPERRFWTALLTANRNYLEPETLTKLADALADLIEQEQ